MKTKQITFRHYMDKNEMFLFNFVVYFSLVVFFFLNYYCKIHSQIVFHKCEMLDYYTNILCPAGSDSVNFNCTGAIFFRPFVNWSCHCLTSRNGQQTMRRGGKLKTLCCTDITVS